jgi:hypothetical protein
MPNHTGPSIDHCFSRTEFGTKATVKQRLKWIATVAVACAVIISVVASKEVAGLMFAGWGIIIFLAVMNDTRWTVGDGVLVIEKSNLFSSSSIAIEKSHVRTISAEIISGSGSECYFVKLTLHDGSEHKISRNSHDEAIQLKTLIWSQLGMASQLNSRFLRLGR